MSFDSDKNVSNFRIYLEYLASTRCDVSIGSSSARHVSEIYKTIIAHSSEIKFMAGNHLGKPDTTIDILESLQQYISSGKAIKIILREYPNSDQSILYKVLSLEGNAKRENLQVKVIQPQRLSKFDRFNNFIVGNNSMYRFENPNSPTFGYANFNDHNNLDVKYLVQAFDNWFLKTKAINYKAIDLYIKNDFEQTCKILIPSFTEINLELIAYFSKNPKALHELDWRKFERLLDAIFKNQGYVTELGPGSGDGGVDIRLIQKDSIGPIITLVQAKHYSSVNPIKLEAVAALSGIVESEKANRGLFVTTSRFLPSAEEWAQKQAYKLKLANSNDIANWCKNIVERNIK